MARAHWRTDALVLSSIGAFELSKVCFIALELAISMWHGCSRASGHRGIRATVLECSGAQRGASIFFAHRTGGAHERRFASA